MKILIVEDDPEARSVLVQGLAECGHRTDCAANSTEGLALAKTEDFDALIIDRMLPDGDGLDIVTVSASAGYYDACGFPERLERGR